MRIISLLISFLFIQSVYADRGLELNKANMNSEQRTALVIGNNAYQKMTPLHNPINDAKSIRKALIKREFEVIYKENATKRDMKKLVKKFSKKISKGGVGMYFYAGHGVSVGGRNFLAGIDSVMDDEDEVEYETLALDYVVSKIKKSGNRLNIIALDACRNNPFGRSGGGGLAPIGNAKGLFVAYATEAGSVASDNKNGTNGLFTKHLLSSINKPGANLNAVFKTTRKGVYQESNGKQSPGVYDQTLGEFYFTLPSDKTKEKIVFYNKKEPKWLSSLDNYPHCALGVGRKGAKYPKREALMTGVMELGFMKEAEVKSMTKIDKDRNENIVNSYTVRVKGNSLKEKVHEQYNWKSMNGDYFALVCKDEGGINIQSVPSSIQYHIEMRHEKNIKFGSDRISVSMKDYVSYDTNIKYKENIKAENYIENKERPEWVIDDRHYILEGMSAVGKATVHDNKFLDAYILSIVNGRNKLSSEMRVQVSSVVNKYVGTEKNDEFKDNLNSYVTKQLVSEKLKGSRLLKLWHDKENNQLYSLMWMSKKFVRAQALSTIKESLKSDKELWQQFKKKANSNN